MIEMTLAAIAEAVGGQLHDADPDSMVTGSVEYDSRRVGPGGLFLALPGEHVDGHERIGSHGGPAESEPARRPGRITIATT